jgi:hypothetical protein
MVNRSSNGKSQSELHRLYDLLDRYEELIEDMNELGVSSVDEAEQRITELNQQIDDAESSSNDGPP